MRCCWIPPAHLCGRWQILGPGDSRWARTAASLSWHSFYVFQPCYHSGWSEYGPPPHWPLGCSQPGKVPFRPLTSLLTDSVQPISAFFWSSGKSFLHGKAELSLKFCSQSTEDYAVDSFISQFWLLAPQSSQHGGWLWTHDESIIEWCLDFRGDSLKWLSLFFPFIFISWRLITLQKWLSLKRWVEKNLGVEWRTNHSGMMSRGCKVRIWLVCIRNYKSPSY